jgi:mannose/cellobiose epimerase-like protein (N-acyl-D-glucosamine 2-epimerase family)
LAHLQCFELPQGLHAWTVSDGVIEDATVMAYGQAFVLLAQAHAHRVGLSSTGDIARAFDAMDAAFFQPNERAYADEITPDGVLLNYRGQNANMHMCEACLAAFGATGEQRYLERARVLIERFAFELADAAGGLVWEHYNAQWAIDWDYNRDNPGNIFKPWGFQTGHQTEWAKLLLIAHGHTPDARYVARAQQLHQAALAHGWDTAHGGLVYGFDLDRQPCDKDKYFWVHAESFASAWRLWRVTHNPVYRDQYLAIWRWSWQHLVDHQYGAWFRVVGADGGKREDTKSPAGKVDYHTMGACWDVLMVGADQPSQRPRSDRPAT